MKDKILVANIGSTSFKFRLFEMPSERLLARGGVERIGSAKAPFSIQVGSEPARKGEAAFPDYAAAIEFVEREIGSALFGDLAAFGFKPVMARGISGCQRLEEPVLQAMEEINTLLPAHNPPYVAAVRAFNRLYPHIPCIGTFETAFFDRVPTHNRRFAIPLEWEQKFGIRRFGFHGASHRFVTTRASELRGAHSKLISCHLGGSSSIACVRDGMAIDSSWGMTPQSGLPMNNRVGDFDAFALIYLARDLGLGLDEVERQLSQNGGLKGMSGLDNGDLRDVKSAAAAGNENARIALDVFTGQIRKFIGQFFVELNGADLLIFTAGIGENNPDLRAVICDGMDFCGLRLDRAANEAAVGCEAIISAKDSAVEVRVIPTNEELIIARDAWAKLSKN